MSNSPYFANVWRLLFTCTRDEKGEWSPMSDADGGVSLYDRIFEWGVEIGRDLDADLTMAQESVDAGKNYAGWLKEIDREPAPT